MKKQIESILNTRKHLLDLVKDLSTEQLNTIPPGFNNNIIWNMGHLVAAQQGVCYLRAGLQTKIGEAFYSAYKPGTKPGNFISESDISDIKEKLLSTIEQYHANYDQGIFENYTPWKTRYGVELATIEEATDFILFHEGLHLGYIMALKHLV